MGWCEEVAAPLSVAGSRGGSGRRTIPPTPPVRAFTIVLAAQQSCPHLLCQGPDKQFEECLDLRLTERRVAEPLPIPTVN